MDKLNKILTDSGVFTGEGKLLTEDSISEKTKEILGATEKLILDAPAIITREGHSVGKTEEFKRSSHPDFAYSSELKAMGWSGIRHNEITQEMEIWKCGNLAASMSVREAQLYPKKWEMLYANTFDLKDVNQVSHRSN